MGYLKSFPFLKDMKCWEPTFWASKFAKNVEPEEGGNYSKLYDEFAEVIKITKENTKDMGGE